ncbi:MAG: DoxX family protein [Candidatus Limnocylindrales bacterium]
MEGDEMGVDLGLLVLRTGIGLIFAAHGAQKAFGWWGGPGPSGWTQAIATMGWHPARPWALLSIVAELGGGLLLIAGLLTPFAAAVLLAQTLVIVKRVHLRNGFWNGKSGIEFPLTLWLGTAALFLAGSGAFSLDQALPLSFAPATRVLVLVVALAGASIAAWWPAPAPTAQPSHM